MSTLMLLIDVLAIINKRTHRPAQGITTAYAAATVHIYE
jgi:hypothetical protein